jgi:hypothetical protein
MRIALRGTVSVVREVVVPAVVAGVVAYVTTLAKTAGEIRKLRAESDEAHFSHRQACYHDLLNADQRLHAVLARERQLRDPEEWVGMNDKFRDCLNGVITSGSDSAAEAARELDEAYFGGGTRAIGTTIGSSSTARAAASSSECARTWGRGAGGCRPLRRAEATPCSGRRRRGHAQRRTRGGCT